MDYSAPVFSSEYLGADMVTVVSGVVFA